MEAQNTFLRSKLGRRIFWLFVLCALVPVVVLAVITVTDVTTQANEQSRRLLRQTSREAAMGIFEQLTYEQAELRLAGSTLVGEGRLGAGVGGEKLLSGMKDKFLGMEVIGRDGRRELLAGRMDAVVGFSDEERSFLESGKSVISTRACTGASACVFLSQELPSARGQTILTAELETTHLWGAENLPPLVDLCVLGPDGRVLFCPNAEPEQLEAKIAQTLSGQFEWDNQGKAEIADYWSVPLKPAFFVSHWKVIASEAKSDVMVPLSHFKKMFLLTALLTFWVVLLLSSIQIRRSMVPLTRLQEGTRQITNGDMKARVEVPGSDEFAGLARSFNFMAARIEKQVNSLRAINEIDRAILSSRNMERIVDSLAGQLHSLLPYEVVGISLLAPGEARDGITYVSGRKARNTKEGIAIRLSAREKEQLKSSPEIRVVEAMGHLASYLAPLAKYGTRYFLVVPILVKSELSGILCLGGESKSAWTDEDRVQAKQLADQVAVALSNARLIAELKELHVGTLTALARAIDAKSSWTAGHSERVTSWAMKIAQGMGLPEHELDIIHRGGLLHDIGKIGTPVSILDKPTKLTDEEMKEMREHVRVGARILEPIPGFAECIPIVLQHHEWVNGQGYPDGLVGEQISLHARIFAVADCFDALISDRPYRRGMSMERVAEIIESGKGKQFDPNVVETFFRVLAEEREKGNEEEEFAPAAQVN